MPYWKNTSGSTFERPGDGTAPGWEAAPGDVVEADTNPAPESFEETKTKPTVPADPADQPAATEE